MIDGLPERLPWYLAGPAIGLLVVALYALGNKRFGVSGSYLQAAEFARGRALSEPWRLWFFVGLFLGALALTLARDGLNLSLAYGALGLLLPLAALVPLLFVAGMVLGYGARWGGGCTSGHGIGGASVLAPESLAATATFMATAVAVTAVLHWLTGGAL
jgi:uncharacterized membrane protein YedE/YeeE